ncbi:ethylene-responsive transcription factor CRF2-like [Momordica charantia]|uniref:Ethylene-responsive transcription factor CRF2-like n=1 Tax=Momordica charantia TaxID=3673 RepID=A0A6J1DVM1_MOMCH|nr:ethylene-responsive transcription factor CRF2-like [Momordica charantia]
MDVPTNLRRKPTTKPPENSAGSRIVRISITDPDATDSSSDDEPAMLLTRRRLKCYVDEVTIETAETGGGRRKRTANGLVRRRRRMKKKSPGNVGKFLGVRRRPWGKWDSGCRIRLWFGTYDTAEDKNAAMKFRGPAVLTNFPTPPPPPPFPGEDSSSSPTSVLHYGTHFTESKPEPPPCRTTATFGVVAESPVVDFPCSDDIFKSILFESPLFFDYQTNLVPETPWTDGSSGEFLYSAAAGSGQGGEEHDFFEEILMGSDPLVVL